MTTLLAILLAQSLSLDGLDAGLIRTELEFAKYLVCGTYEAPLYSGFSFTSNVASQTENIADWVIVSPVDRTGPMLQLRVQGSSGPQVMAVHGDGTVYAGRHGGRAAFVESSGISGATALTCHPYTNEGGCYTTITGNLRKASFHGAVTIGNAEPRDGGLVLQVNGNGRGDAYAHTVATISEFGDLTLWSGTVQPYFTLLPSCVAGVSTLDGAAGEGALAWWTVTKCLYVCDGAEGWEPVRCKGGGP